MKVNRVILSSNNNPTYFHFWNPLSKIYFEKFKIVPTLVWIGTEEEAKDCGISDEYGDIIYQPHHPDYHIPWQTTWALFWATQFYPNDVCWIMGIDQVPLSRMFIDMVKEMEETDYAMLIADAYKPHHWSKDGSASPSSYHIAKGETFDKVYQFDADFKTEMTKVHQSGILGFWENTEGRWGIDETYSCHKLRQYAGKIHSLDNFGMLVNRRIECQRHIETEYNMSSLRAGWFSESHLCRPYTNHVEYINRILENIPTYE